MELGQEVPLCVDLDGTLLRTDLLYESLLALLKENPLYLFLLPFWLLKGKAGFKAEIAHRVALAPALLPYHDRFLAHLREQHAAGRRLVLATASHQRYAEAVAAHLGLFEAVFATGDDRNLSGPAKGERLREAFGERGFDYAGNSTSDLPVWSLARRAILVNPHRGVAAAAQSIAEVSACFEDPPPRLREYLKAMRLHQWLKNLLLVVPLALAHRIGDLALLFDVAVAFLTFGLCASSVYLLNDLLDLPADRAHPTKGRRPFAAGRIPVQHGIVLTPLLLLGGLLLALSLPIQFLGVLGIYYLTTLAYSFRLKRAALVDVLTLAALYTLRIVAGGAAVAVPLSFWLLAFSMFLFLSLALVKRYTELSQMRDLGKEAAAGRGYRAEDLETLAQFGASSGYMAVLVLALYINSDAVRMLYRTPELIWMLCPLMLYLISRIWLLARRDELHEDPVVFAIEDRKSHWIALIGALLLWGAM